MKRFCKLLLCIAVVAAALTACGGASKSAAYEIQTNAAAAMIPGAGAIGAEKFDMAVAETVDANYAYTESSKSEAGSSLTTSNSIDPAADLGRKLIRTIYLDVETDEFDVLLEKLNQQIIALAGYVEQSDISGKSIQNEHSRRHAHMTVRIPSTNLNHFVTSVEESGNVTNKSETTTDVTIQYSDLESKKKSLSIEQERILELLEKADTLESVIALEERLSEIRYELESMESRLRLYDNQVEYSTIYVNVEEVKIYTPTAPLTIGERIEKGFTKNIENMKESFVDFIVWLASSTPILIPAIALFTLVIFSLRKKIANRKLKKMATGISASFDSEKPSDDPNK